MSSFYEYRSSYSAHGNDFGFKNYEDFYLGFLSQYEDENVRAEILRRGSTGFDASSVNRMVNEYNWYKDGRPYFCLHNDMVELFRDVEIDIPMKHFVLPYQVFVIRLEEGNGMMCLDRELKTLLVCKMPYITETKESLVIWVDSGETIDGTGVLDYLHLGIYEEQSVQQNLLNILGRKQLSDLTMKDHEVLLRLVFSVSFLATGSDKLVRPDVLSKDLAAWLEAYRKKDDERLRVIETRSEKRKGKGFVIGGPRSIVATETFHAPHSEGTGSEKSRHTRRAHFRRLENKVVFVRQAVIRADLPG